MPKSLQEEQTEKDEASGVICFPLCAGEEDPLPLLHSPHISISVSVLMSGNGSSGKSSR
jgi:hypothetical protein